MGVYMSKPIKDKESTDFTGKLLKCGASSMQGWRVSQEDAHNCCLDFDEDISLFAVYDGHGGHEVAEYASRHLPKVIKDNEAYKKGEYSRALIDAFLEFDATLKTPTVMEELEKISDGKKTKDGRLNEDDDDEEEANVAKLREEASMPLAEVIAMYANGGFPKTPKNKLLAGTSKPMSPFLRAVKPSGSKDSEVSSSSSVPSSSLTNGQPDESTSTTKPSETVSEEPDQSEPAPINQEKSGGSSGCSSSAPEVTSSSTNGEAVASSTTSKEEPSSTSAASSTSPNRPRREGATKKKDLAASLLENTLSSDDESSNDETFHTNDDGASSSDEEEVQLNGSKDCEDDSDEEEDEDEDGDGDGGEEVDEESEAEDEEPGMDSGCTAVVALVTKDKLYVANAGDSRAVLCRNGTAVDLSVDHKPEDPIELKRIQNAGGKVTNDGRVNGGLNLSRALGDHYYKRSADLDAREQMITALPDVLTETLDRTTDEFIVLACDGIWNSMSSQEVVDFVRPLVQKGETLSAICEKLFESCLAPDTMGDGTGCDNMTCVIVQLLPPGSEASNKRPPSDSAEIVERQPDSKKAKLGEETES